MEHHHGEIAGQLGDPAGKTDAAPRRSGSRSALTASGALLGNPARGILGNPARGILGNPARGILRPARGILRPARGILRQLDRRALDQLERRALFRYPDHRAVVRQLDRDALLGHLDRDALLRQLDRDELLRTRILERRHANPSPQVSTEGAAPSSPRPCTHR
ncbi:hypothetical protein [Sorangium sp. So ce513]|uniref:hypothetical protein n=1 Tax=Sorangium sp. So ce513 TaxID=3133315 RepID=UPI003F626277